TKRECQAAREGTAPAGLFQTCKSMPAYSCEPCAHPDSPLPAPPFQRARLSVTTRSKSGFTARDSPPSFLDQPLPAALVRGRPTIGREPAAPPIATYRAV